ncbi:MAG: hypothetical protein L6V93_22930 [Clostridiales bacterium]|nr:MAG: hypothetical protein L6V93_22930 [Clostridiales bacterium]
MTTTIFFGQNYAFFGIDSSLGTVKVSNEQRLIEIPWTIKRNKGDSHRGARQRYAEQNDGKRRSFV